MGRRAGLRCFVHPRLEEGWPRRDGALLGADGPGLSVQPSPQGQAAALSLCFLLFTWGPACGPDLAEESGATWTQLLSPGLRACFRDGGSRPHPTSGPAVAY